MASSVEQARREFRTHAARGRVSRRIRDRSTRGGESLESAVALLTETAPVVVAAAPEKQADLAFLITSGAVDFVARTGHFVPIAAGMLDRRVRIAERVAGMIQFPDDELAGRFRRNSSPRSQQSADRHSRQYRTAACAARPPAACRRRAPADHRRTCRAPPGNRSPPLECLGGTSRARAARRERTRSKRHARADHGGGRMQETEQHVPHCLPASLPRPLLGPEQHVFPLK